jgi:hypothetical protein
VIQTKEADMLRFLKNLLMFRIGQKTTRGVARSIGLGKIATVAGLIGGYKHMRRHASS